MDYDFVELLSVVNPTVGMLLGCFLTIFGSILMSLGSTFMKLGLDYSAQKEQSKTVSSFALSEPVWLSGFTAYVLGSALHIIALAFAPASVLSPMNSFGLIINAISAAVILQEPFGWIEFYSTFGTFIGVSFCAMATLIHSYHKDNEKGMSIFDTCVSSWNNPWYLCYLAACAVSSFGALTYLNYADNKLIEENQELLEAHNSYYKLSEEISSARPASDDTSSVGNAGNSNAQPLLFEEKISPLQKPSPNVDAKLENPTGKWNSKCIGLAYGFLAGLIGAQCVLQLKEMVACFQYSLDDPDIWNLPQPYISCTLLCLSIWLQIHFLNLGLSRGEATLVVPTYYIIWTFFGTLGGFAKFDEYIGFGIVSVILYSFGFIVTVACIGILAVQEMNFLRRFVDQRVPDVPADSLDLETQELFDKHLGAQVTLGMGMFPISKLGAAAGRKRMRLRNFWSRRIRSTLSEAAFEDSDDFSIGYPGGRNSQTLPPSIYFPGAQYINFNAQMFTQYAKKGIAYLTTTSITFLVAIAFGPMLYSLILCVQHPVPSETEKYFPLEELTYTPNKQISEQRNALERRVV